MRLVEEGWLPAVCTEGRHISHIEAEARAQAFVSAGSGWKEAASCDAGSGSPTACAAPPVAPLRQGEVSNKVDYGPCLSFASTPQEVLWEGHFIEKRNRGPGRLRPFCKVDSDPFESPEIAETRSYGGGGEFVCIRS